MTKKQILEEIDKMRAYLRAQADRQLAANNQQASKAYQDALNVTYWVNWRG